MVYDLKHWCRIIATVIKKYGHVRKQVAESNKITKCFKSKFERIDMDNLPTKR